MPALTMSVTMEGIGTVVSVFFGSRSCSATAGLLACAARHSSSSVPDRWILADFSVL